MPKRDDKKIKPYYLKDGTQKYILQAYLGQDAQLHRIMVTRQGFDTYAEAEAKYHELKANFNKDYVKPHQIKVSELWNQWFENHKLTVKESSANKNYQWYKNHIEPTFGESYVDKITVVSVQRWINSEFKKFSKYRDAYNLFNRFMTYGYKLGYMKSNPLDKVIVPKKVKQRSDKENYYDNIQDVNTLLNAAKKQSLRKYTFFKLLFSTGIRKSEALALEWSDVDFKNHIIHITKTLAQGLDNKQLIQPPKTMHSYRDVPMSTTLEKSLLDYRRNQKVIFPVIFTKANGDYLNLAAPSNWLNYVYKENPTIKRITIHGMRHTFATLMLQPDTGLTPKDVQTILGHESIDMTLNVYTHESEKGKNLAVKIMNQMDI